MSAPSSSHVPSRHGRRNHPFLTLFLLSLLVSVSSAASASSFGSFVSSYDLSSLLSAPSSIAVGSSGTLYAVAATADSFQLYAYASSATSTPAVVSTAKTFQSIVWMAAQPGSDLLLLADLNGGGSQGRFVLVDGSSGATPYGDLTGFAGQPVACGFLSQQRVALVYQDGSGTQGLSMSVVSIGAASAGSLLPLPLPTTLGDVVGFSTDYTNSRVLFSFMTGGVVVLDSSAKLVATYMASSDNAIAFIDAALATDTLGHTFLLQSTVTTLSNVQLIAVDTATGALQADKQLGSANGGSTAPLSQSVNSAGVPISVLAVDGQGQLYGLSVSGLAVQVFSGLSATQPVPAPLTSSTAGYYLGQIVNDDSSPALPFTNPTSLAFNPANGDRYIVDSAHNRVVQQSSSGAFIRSLAPGYVQPAEVRVSGALVLVSEPYYAVNADGSASSTAGTLYVLSATTGAPLAPITKDDQGNALASGQFVSFDVDASGNVLLPIATVDASGTTATIRLSTLRPTTGAAVPGSSFAIAGSVAVPSDGEGVVSDFRVDRVNGVAYFAFTAGSVGAYSLAAATQGALLRTFTTWGDSNPFVSPYGLELDTAGRLYVADYQQGVIVLDAATGAYVDNFQGYYSTAADIATNSVTVEPSTGHVFMTDDSLSRVVVVQGFTAPLPSSSSSSSTGSLAATTGSSSSTGSSGGAVVGDPQFVGFRGQSFQVHGIDGHVYSLISSPTLQVNALFVFLGSGRCPNVTGRPADNCWTHPGSYIGAIAVQQRDDDGSIHRVLVTAGEAATGLAGVEVDGVELEQQRAQAGRVAVERLSAYEVRIGTPHFELLLVNSDGFLNEQVRPLVSLKQLAPHGLLGQTWRLSKRVVEGDVEDYSLSGNELFGADSLYDRFTQSTADEAV